MPHAWALLELNREQGLTVTQLAARLNVDRTNVSRLCTRMEASGELERIANPDDGRARLLALTPEGRRLAKRVDAASAKHFGAVLRRLEEKPAVVIEALDALCRAMEDEG